MSQPYVQKTPRRGPRLALILAAAAAVALIVVVVALAPYVVVPTGHTGIVTTFGRVENYTLPEG